MKKYYSLISPLWLLYNVESISEIKLDRDIATIYKRQHSLEQRIQLHNELKEVESQLHYDFLAFSRTFPKRREIKFNNNEIHEYLMRFKSFMESEEFHLLN